MLRNLFHQDLFSHYKLRRLAFLSIVPVNLFILSACQPPNDQLMDKVDNATLSLSLCTQETFPHRGNRKDFQCGSLSVPENPEDPAGRNINLNIVRLPALSHSPKDDPIFVLAGGPGQASTEIVNSVSPWMRLVNRERDFIFVDQRGTGKSNPLDCAEDVETDYSQSFEEQEVFQLSLLTDCLANYDADLRFYTTPFAADDIYTVAESLGYERINLWGASYGTRFALEIIRRHPNLVRSAVLDSVAPIGINLPQFAVEDGDRSLQTLFDLCEQQAQCNERFPNLQSRTKNFIKALDDSPKNISVIHPLKGEPFELVLNGQAFASLVRLGLYVRDLAPTLPFLIDAAIKENYGPLMTLLSLSEEVSDGISLGLQTTILCAEDVANIPSNLTNADNSILQLQSLDAMSKVCSQWPEGILPNDFFEPVSSDIPILLLSGNLDPVTPPRWGEKAASNLSNSKHIVVAGAHHNVSHLGCVPKIIDEFIEGLNFEVLDTECTQSILPLPPFINASGPAMLRDAQ